MGRKGKRVRLDRGIYEDSAGRSIVWPVNGRPREERFPKDTPIAELRRERGKRIGEPAPRKTGATPVRDTLAAAVERWTKLERHLSSWRERHAELKAWVARYGSR